MDSDSLTLQSRLLEELVLPGCYLPVEVDGAPAGLRLLFGEMGGVEPIQIPIEIGGEPSQLSLCFEGKGSIADRVREFGGLEALGGAIKNAAITAAASEAIDALEKAIHQPIRLHNNRGSSSAAATGSASGLALGFELINGAQEPLLQGKVLLSPSAWEKLFSGRSQWKQGKPPAIQNRQFRGALTLTKIELSEEEWRSLKIGDTILLEDWPQALQQKMVFLTEEGFRFCIPVAPEDILSNATCLPQFPSPEVPPFSARGKEHTDSPGHRHSWLSISSDLFEISGKTLAEARESPVNLPISSLWIAWRGEEVFGWGRLLQLGDCYGLTLTAMVS